MDKSMKIPMNLQLLQNWEVIRQEEIQVVEHRETSRTQIISRQDSPYRI